MGRESDTASRSDKNLLLFNNYNCIINNSKLLSLLLLLTWIDPDKEIISQNFYILDFGSKLVHWNS